MIQPGKNVAPSIDPAAAESLRWLFFAGVLFGPFIVTAILVVALPEQILGELLCLIWLSSVAAGGFCIYHLPMSAGSRELLALFYVPLMACHQFSFMLACVVSLR